MTPKGLQDAKSRVLVNILLDGSRPQSSIRTELEALGVEISAASDFGSGSFSAYLPVSVARKAGAIDGVRSIILESAGTNRVGKITSEGLKPMRADKLLAIPGDKKGKGITIGVLSDSFASDSTGRDADVASGDLPSNIVVIEDIALGSDEGRAMLQIVHDVAPLAKLCFATAFTGQAAFANNILKLASKTGPCKANIIVDDVGYFAQSFSQDGIVNDAVNKVTAKGVAYFSSAGNGNGDSQEFTYNPISWAAAKAANSGLKLDQVPANLEPVSVHVYKAGAKPQIFQKLNNTAGARQSLRWDDPTANGKVTRNFDMLYFNDAGDFIGFVNDDNKITDVPFEAASFGGINSVRVMIVLHDKSDSSPRKSILRQDMIGGGQFGAPFNVGSPAIYGHPCATGTFAIAAVFAGSPATPEEFSSKGPCTIRMDKTGKRLATPIVRKKPDLAAPDGVSTTFFSGSPGPSGFPRFFGTSAAAPHAAAAAALFWADKGRGTPAALRARLSATAIKHPKTAELVSKTISSAAGTLKFVAKGAVHTVSDDFNISVSGIPAGAFIKTLKLDFSTMKPISGDVVPDTLIVDSKSGVARSSISNVSPAGGTSVGAVTMTFKPGKFVTGKHLVFGLRYGTTDGFGYIAGQLVGATVTATLSNGKVITGKISADPVTALWDRSYGKGVIDVFKAVRN